MSLFKKMKAQQTLKLNYKTVKLSADAFAQRSTELKDTFDYWHKFSKLNNELNKGIQPVFLQKISLANSKILHFVLKSIEKLVEIELGVSLEQVASTLFNERSKLLLGQENRFWKLAKF